MLRRRFLKTLGGTLAAASAVSAIPLSARPTHHHKGGNLRKLLVIFQRGGNDSLNTLVPVDSTEYARYAEYRPNLHIPQGQLLSFNNTSFFGYHPSLAPLADLIQAGKASFVHAVGYPSMTTSHFAGQAFWETGDPHNRRGSGWLNRYLHASSGPGAFRGLMVDGNTSQMMSGPFTVPVSRNFGGLNMPIPGNMSGSDNTRFREMVRDLAEDADYLGHDLLERTTNGLLGMFDAFNDRNLNDYTPANNAEYPGGRFGDALKHAAQMLKENPSPLNVEAVMVNHPNYDHHKGQVAGSAVEGWHAGRLSELANGIKAFTTDLGDAQMQDTLILVVSEFGRTVRENGSRGTDHGRAALAMLFGGTVTGRVINGEGAWPGLNGQFLNWNTDYRGLYWEILERHMGASPDVIRQAIPNFTPQTVGAVG
ncbi:DUF1501 domain-containing protein [Acanthopleuribacter pedis]|uniref:DUF1501 domain-containing protein n=1 Tax=Acanthopleuribacter pedis TaxID=442870 RepID=A0A8J7U3T1_9BACT|nr:DUF1501 domain-containing protein [Acanthopleuribacter pedis]MBO1320763.1 DUF1501 domain-containing protein [Acanthopleuribacter pedis]